MCEAPEGPFRQKVTVTFSAGREGLGNPPVAPANEGRGEKLVREAVTALEGRLATVARIDQQMDVFGQQLRGKGEYWEQRTGPWPRVRLELKIPMGDQKGNVATIVQLSDGQTYWTSWQLLDESKLTQVDLTRVAEVMKDAEGAGLDRADSPELAWSIGVGGVAGLLRELDRAFRFEVVGKSKMSDVPVWRLRGRWRPELLVKLLPKQKEAIQEGRGVELDRLAAHLPHEVLLFLGDSATDPFPYRIEYHRGDARDVKPNAPDGPRPMVALQFLEVRKNPDIDPSHFRFHPGGVKPTDETQRVLERLKTRTSPR
ncbi:MAG: hypothetical protein JW818_14270 [Pirellulales bacterium]|nr:hypothetical protein [Pirellulales bacterium]